MTCAPGGAKLAAGRVHPWATNADAEEIMREKMKATMNFKGANISEKSCARGGLIQNSGITAWKRSREFE